MNYVCTCGKANTICPMHPPMGIVPSNLQVPNSVMRPDFDDSMEFIDSTELAKLRATLQSREAEIEGLREALRVIQLCLKAECGEVGEYWSARKWLRDHNRYEGNLQALAVLLEVCDTALKFSSESALSAKPVEETQ